MTAPTTDRPHVGTDPASTSGDSPRPPVSGSKDFEVGPYGFSRGKTIAVIVVLIVAAVAAVVGTVHYKDDQAKAGMRARDEAEALTDLNNRIDTEHVGGKFTRAFYVGDQMRAEWVRNDQLKRCVFAVVPPTSKVKRWVTKDVVPSVLVLNNIKDPDMIGGLQSVPCGAIGGG